MNLKQISSAALPRALALAERYRLLNEPEQAASIYRDVLETDPSNPDAQRNLLLCITDQFSEKHGPGMDAAESLLVSLANDYEREYYHGIICERWGRAKLIEGAHASFVGSWIKKAMVHYGNAEQLSPSDNENATLRWNACARLIARIPGLAEVREEQAIFED